MVLIPDHSPTTNLQQGFSRWTYSGHSLLPTKNGSRTWTTRSILNWHNSYTWNSWRIKKCKCILEICISNSFYDIRGYSCCRFSTCSACSNNLLICSGVAQVPSLRLLTFAEYSMANHSSVTCWVLWRQSNCALLILMLCWYIHVPVWAAWEVSAKISELYLIRAVR